MRQVDDRLIIDYRWPIIDVNLPSRVPPLLEIVSNLSLELFEYTMVSDWNFFFFWGGGLCWLLPTVTPKLLPLCIKVKKLHLQFKWTTTRLQKVSNLLLGDIKWPLTAVLGVATPHPTPPNPTVGRILHPVQSCHTIQVSRQYKTKLLCLARVVSFKNHKKILGSGMNTR